MRSHTPPRVPTPASSAAIGRDPAQSTRGPLTVPRLQVIREGKASAFLDVRPAWSSASVHWKHVTLEDYVVPSCVISRHEHPEPFVHVVVSGSVNYQVATAEGTRRFLAVPGTTFVLPQGTTDEVIWEGTTHRIALSMQPQLLASAMAETTGASDIELVARWDLVDGRIQALVQAMAADLSDGSPVGALYGEHLATALAVYLIGRYAARPKRPASYKGGLPGRRLRRVLDYIGDNLAEDLSLAQLASVVGMSPHYFSELFRQSMGQTPHNFVLLRRIDRAKEQLRDVRRSVIDAAVECGFQNASHFARTFRRFVGVTPSEFQRSV
jgi:AraC family transcriptional regulator